MPAQTLRLLVLMPSWVGDAVMATPALRVLRDANPGIFIGGLLRPGIEQVLAGTGFFDEVHVAQTSGVMGPKFAAAKLRPRRYDTALLFTNSFSSAVTARVAGVSRRIGYDRDGRGLLLTDRLEAPRRADGRWATVPAVDYYLQLVRGFLVGDSAHGTGGAPLYMELATTSEEERAADDLLGRAGLAAHGAVAILNPGGNNEAKRWPPDRFARLAEHLVRHHALDVLVNGSPAEAEVVRAVAAGAGVRVHELPALGVTLGSLKALVKRSRLMVTNDTGPRHFAAAFGVPLVSLFGPTDPRWTTIPTRPGAPEFVLSADPTLPESEVADDHPERCRIDRISEEKVREAVDRALDARAPGAVG